MLDITCISAADLEIDHLAAWSNIRETNHHYASFYFSPEFTLTVHEICQNVQVAVFKFENRYVGFFPFQKTSFAFAKPVGSPLSDFHGPIMYQDTVWDWSGLLRACRIRSFSFDHLIENSATYGTDIHVTLRSCMSPYIYLRKGYEHFLEERKKTTSQISRLMRLTRKAERESGSVRFVYNSNDQQVLNTLIQWKKEQYRLTGSTNPFNKKWVNDFIHRLFLEEREEGRCILSALYVGQELVAAHLGILNNENLHWWFPSYNRDFGKYSPGLLLLMRTIQSAAEHGIKRIDLGKGEEKYKLDFMTGYLRVHEGAVDTNLLINKLHVYYHSLKQQLLPTAVGQFLKRRINSS